MNFYFDTEFIEGAKQRRVLGFKVGAPVPTIDLISIGIVAEDGREFYALNADCELGFAWGSEWVRENVLRKIWEEYAPSAMRHTNVNYFCLEVVQDIFEKHGLSRQQLTGALVDFVYPMQFLTDELNKVLHIPGCDVVGSYQGECLRGPGVGEYYDREEAIEWALHCKAAIKPQFYAHYADYDWVVLCQLFGRMLDLPKGFPMYCHDLKQEQDRLGISSERKQQLCPDPKKEHHALEDARWAKQWHAVLQRYGTELGSAHKVLTLKFGTIEHLLRVPALENKGDAEDRLRFMLKTLAAAARGEEISNKPGDYY